MGMVVLLPDGMTQSVVAVAIGVHALVHLMMELLLLLLLQRIFVQRAILHFLEFLVGLSSCG